MKRGNELVKRTKYKIFLYTDDAFEMDYDNVFLSSVYRGVKEFKRDNPGMRPLIAYEAEDVVGKFEHQLKKLKHKKNNRM